MFPFSLGKRVPLRAPHLIKITPRKSVSVFVSLRKGKEGKIRENESEIENQILD